jgi:hypothetical protein
VVLKLSHYLLPLPFTCFPIHYSLFTLRSNVFKDAESAFQETVKKVTYRVNICYIFSLHNREIYNRQEISYWYEPVYLILTLQSIIRCLI